MSRDRGKAATLMQGAVDRSDIYKSVELPLDALIEKNLSHVLKVGRDIRKAEAGEDLAAEEERRGSKTDEEYAEEAAARRIAREQERERVEEEIRVKAREAAREQEREEARQKARQQEEDRKRREEELEKLRAEELAKRLELEKLRAAEEKKREEEARKEQEIAAIEKRKAIEREVQQHEAQLYTRRQLVQEKEIEKRELFQRREKQILERERARNRGEESARLRLEAAETDRPNAITSRSQAIEFIKVPPAPPMAPPVDEKALEEVALQLLLREGREMAAKSSSKPNFERNEPLDSPHQKIAPFSKAKLAESSPLKSSSLKVSSPLKSPLRKPDLPPVPKLGYSAIKIRAPSNPNYHSNSYTELHGSLHGYQPRPTHQHNTSNRKSSRSRSRSKTRPPSYRPEEHHLPDEKEVYRKRTQSFTALRESDVDTYKFAPGRRSSETHDHEMLPQLDNIHGDYQNHHQYHLDRLEHDKLSRSRERLHGRSRSSGAKNGKIMEYEPIQGEKVHRFSVQSAVEAIDPYALDEGEINIREQEEDRRDWGREESYRSKRPTGDSERKGEFRDGMEWSDGGRGESYRGRDGREENYRRFKNRGEKRLRHEGREGKYSEHDGRRERYRRHKAREGKYTRHDGREEKYPRHEEREDNYPKHELREDNYPRHDEREERFRDGGQDERYRREGGRDDSRYRREGWREEKARVVHVAPIDRYVPGGGELKRGKGREGVEDIDRYAQR